VGKCTILDICKETGVSVATVSRVLNNSPRVTDETRTKILEAINRLGYKPNAAARNLSGRRSNVLGVIFHQLTSGFYASVMSGIHLEARTRGYHLLVTLVHHADPERSSYYDMLDEARIDGLIVLDSTLDDATLAKLQSYNRPIVLIERTSGNPAPATVGCANEAAAHTAVSHLLSRGYRDMLIVTGPPEAEDSGLRMKGCQQALKDAGLSSADVKTISGNYSAHDAREAFRKHVDEQGLPRAVFAFNDDMALSIMRELRVTGIDVPGQVAVVGFDGIEAAEYMGLTTMQMPMLELGAEAVRLLLERIKTPTTPARHVLKDCELVVRESSGGG